MAIRVPSLRTSIPSNPVPSDQKIETVPLFWEQSRLVMG